MPLDGTRPTSLKMFARRPSMRDEIIETLRGAVISGELAPNQIYSGPILAEYFGVSATPVREAMIRLANEGLVETVRNKGFRILEPSSAELDELAGVRMLLEVPTVRHIAEAISSLPIRVMVKQKDGGKLPADLSGTLGRNCPGKARHHAPDR